MGSTLCSTFFFFQAEDGIRDDLVTGVQTCALPIYLPVVDLPDLKTWPSMQLLLNQARDAVMANDIGKTLLSGEMARAMVSRLDPGSPILRHFHDAPFRKTRRPCPAARGPHTRPHPF